MARMRPNRLLSSNVTRLTTTIPMRLLNLFVLSLTFALSGCTIIQRTAHMLKAAGCRTVEGPGSSVTFEYNGRKMTLHRPHPSKEALRYRVLAVREFIQRIGIKP